LVNTYDALNRLVSRSVPSVPSVDRFSYDAVGNLLTASNAVAREAFTYDVMNRVAAAETTVNGITFSTAWKRDLGGLVTNILYAPGKAVTRTYDTDGRLATVSDWQGHTWTFTHDGASKLTSVLSPGGILSTNEYDLAGRLSGWSVGGVAGRVITRDAAGIKTKENVTAGLFPNPQNPRRAVNTFDAADRLVSATVAQGTNTYAETYLYDLNGALTNTVSGSESVFDAAYDALGQLTSLNLRESVSSVDYSYDPIGNRIVCGDRIWIPDHADSLKRPLIEADASGMPVRYFVWGGGMLLAVVEADGTMRYCHSDEQGSIVALTDSNGDVTDQFCYGPYGTDWGRTGTNSIPFRWLGSHGVFNVGGGSLYLTRHRLYSASLCRFLSADPLGLDGGPNLYAYCLGNPLAYIDPQGLAISAAASGVARAIDTVWNFGIQFATFNPNATPQVQEAMYQANLSSFGSPMQRLFGAYDTPASQPITIAPEIVSSAWEAGAVRVGLPNVGANGVGAKPLYHYTSGEAANSVVSQGLQVGRDGFVYTTPNSSLTPFQAQIELALPANRPVPNALLQINVEGLNRVGIFPVIGPHPVQGNLPGLGAGGGTEVLFDQAIPPQFIQRVR